MRERHQTDQTQVKLIGEPGLSGKPRELKLAKIVTNRENKGTDSK